MRTIHNINKWSYGITLVLYVTIYFGLIAQAGLGAIQLLLGLGIIFQWNKLDLQGKKLISVYWLLVVFYFTIPFIAPDHFDDFWLTSYVLAPMCIATYFVFVTYKVAKEPTVAEILNHEVL